MPSSSSPAPAPQEDVRIRSVLEKGVKFHIKAGGNKWQCTILDRASHERQKATRSGSSSSIDSTNSETSSTHSK